MIFTEVIVTEKHINSKKEKEYLRWKDGNGVLYAIIEVSFSALEPYFIDRITYKKLMERYFKNAKRKYYVKLDDVKLFEQYCLSRKRGYDGSFADSVKLLGEYKFYPEDLDPLNCLDTPLEYVNINFSEGNNSNSKIKGFLGDIVFMYLLSKEELTSSKYFSVISRFENSSSTKRHLFFNDDSEYKKATLDKNKYDKKIKHLLDFHKVSDSTANLMAYAANDLFKSYAEPQKVTKPQINPDSVRNYISKNYNPQKTPTYRFCGYSTDRHCCIITVINSNTSKLKMNKNRNPSQNISKGGMSANTLGKDIFDKNLEYEWLHLSAHSYGNINQIIGGKLNKMQAIGNPQDTRNLVLGTKAANTQMIIIEDMVKRFIESCGGNPPCKCTICIDVNYIDLKDLSTGKYPDCLMESNFPLFPNWLTETIEYQVIFELGKNKKQIYSQKIIFKPFQTVTPSLGEYYVYQALSYEKFLDSYGKYTAQSKSGNQRKRTSVEKINTSENGKTLEQILHVNNFVCDNSNWFLFSDTSTQVAVQSGVDGYDIISFTGTLSLANLSNDNPLSLFRGLLNCGDGITVEGEVLCKDANSKTDSKFVYASFSTKNSSINLTDFLDLKDVFLCVLVERKIDISSSQSSFCIMPMVSGSIDINGLGKETLSLDCTILYQEGTLSINAIGNDVEDFFGISGLKMEEVKLSFAVGKFDEINLNANFTAGDLTYYFTGMFSKDNIVLQGEVDMLDLNDLDDLYSHLTGKQLPFGDDFLFGKNIYFEEICITLAKNEVGDVKSGLTVACSTKLAYAECDLVFNVSAHGVTLEYDFILPLDLNLDLSKLPLIGTELHILDHVAINQITFIYTSKDGVLDGYQVKKGASIGFTFNDSRYVLALSGESSGRSVPYGYGKANIDTNGMTAFHWFDVNKDISIASIYRIGAGVKKDQFIVLFDASVHITPLILSLDSLGVGASFKDPSNVSFGLSGLLLQYKKPPLLIDGALKRTASGGHDVYDGFILLKFSQYSVMAIASYSNNAIFAYAAVNAPFGGPPMLFVTGIAAGFGYNEDIVIPGIEELNSYPLIEGARGEVRQEDLAPKLAETMKPQKGQYFFAVGVKFTTFKIIDSFVLLSVELGPRTEVALLGVSELSVPFNASKNNAIAHAELALKAAFSPEEGVFVQAQLTNDSYILSKKCRLTGGFSFCIWLGDAHRGDYVITLGGYHPSYKKPDYYPDVPRLGFDWNVGGGLKLSGRAYFALTPRCVMAGGCLDGSFHLGPVTAWFTISADIMVQWKPLFYSISMRVGFGVKINLWLLHINIELSAGLEIWGPEFSGYAKVKCIHTFKIHFGAHAVQSAPAVTWNEFKEEFLPEHDGKKAVNVIHIADGLIKEMEYKGEKISIVHFHGLAIITQSVIPCTSIAFNRQNVSEAAEANGNVGVYPMKKSLRSQQNVSVKKDGKEIDFNTKVETENLSASLWGTKYSKEELVKNAATGLKLTPKQQKEQIELYPKTEGKYINLEELARAERFHKKYHWMNPPSLTEEADDQSFHNFETHIMSEAVSRKRNQWVFYLSQSGYDMKLSNVDLTQLADHANEVYDENVWLGDVV